ncbi:helix-turn-helix domain-containing protein [Vibrio alginolyticus]|nr:helix-turn-helix domain-containing protein [Vibrio alginolyticus]
MPKSQTQKQTQRLMPYSEVCEILNRSYKCLWVWTKEGKFIQPVRLNGRAIGFKREDFEQWLAEHS